MRLALRDVKKSVVRRDGEAYLVPHLLRRGDLQGELAALIALHEMMLGQPRHNFPADRPAEIMGDYRLARGLLAALGDWYVWEPPAWPGPANADEAAALEAAGIASPSQLRLTLYDAVHTEGDGYLPVASREPFLDAFAQRLHLRRSNLDALLELDAEEQAALRRRTESVPTPDALAARYNWRAVEAVLSAAASVTWTLPPTFAAARGTTLGTLLKRICFLARRMGVYYDAEYAETASAGSTAQLARVAEPRADYAVHGVAPRLDDRQGPINVLLYGPQEAFGGPARYGDRLAALCRTILGLNRPESDAPPLPRGALCLRGEALVYLRSLPFRFSLDERLLALLLAPSGDESEAVAPTGASFDSEPERDLADEFAALERAHAAHGWHLEREPEPVLSGSTIFIPDFTLSRGPRRVYLELAGYWSPAYRERKCRKLLALAGHIDLLLAAPDDARAAFAPLEGLIPCVWYARRLTARALLSALSVRWDDFAVRRAAVPHAAILADVAGRGVVSSDALSAASAIQDRTELAQVVADLLAAAQRDGQPEPRFVEGLGLVSAAWLAGARTVMANALAHHGAAMPVADLTALLSSQMPELRCAEDVAAATESLALATGFLVDRQDLFRPIVSALDSSHATTPADPPPDERAYHKRAQPHSARRRTLSEESHVMGNLWDDTPE